jgi:NADH dehydrogenase
MTSSRPHRVIVIGSGFGGLFAVKRLKRADANIVLISRTAHHLFQPLLYQVATGILSEGEIAPATREVLRNQDNVQVLLGDVTAIDTRRRVVTSAVAGVTTETPYDSLVVAAGARTSYFGSDEFETFAPGLKSIDDALDLRGRIFGAFELAELRTDEQARREWMTFVVVGAGPTGVEMAGQIAELAHRVLPEDFRRIDTRRTQIVLVDAAGAVLESFGSRLAGRAVSQLEKLGITVWLNRKVVSVDARGLTVQNALGGGQERIEARTVIWAAGVQASALAAGLAEQTGAQLAGGGRIKVQQDCTLPGHPEIFVIGDMMALSGCPGVAQVAMQQGRYAADQIMRRLEKRKPKGPFHYLDKGSMATISRFRAVASVGRYRFGGVVAWFLWLTIHVIYLVGFKNRLTTVLHWAVSFIGRGRSQRTTTTSRQLTGPSSLAPSPGAPPAISLQMTTAHVPGR